MSGMHGSYTHLFAKEVITNKIQLNEFQCVEMQEMKNELAALRVEMQKMNTMLLIITEWVQLQRDLDEVRHREVIMKDFVAARHAHSPEVMEKPFE